MRHLTTITACIALLMTACNDPMTDQPGNKADEVGSVTITLDADHRNEIQDVRSSSEEMISVDDFWVEIFNSKNVRLFCEKYSDAKDEVINLNTGDYRLLAKHGDSLGVGFDKPFYMADCGFFVEPRKDNSVSATARLANVKASVVFGENLSNSYFYGDCHVILRNVNPRVKSSLRFNLDETRAGYIPAGDLVLEVYAKIGDTYMYYPMEARTYSPNDFVTFHIDADEREGDMKVSVLIDDSVEVKEEVIVMTGEHILPYNAPVIVRKSFDANGNFSIASGTVPASEDLEVSVNAEASMASMTLTTYSEFISESLIPRNVDLLNPGTHASGLEEAGLVWHVNPDATLAVVDFEYVAKYLAKNAKGVSGQVAASFTLKVTDTRGKTASTSFKFIFK